LVLEDIGEVGREGRVLEVVHHVDGRAIDVRGIDL